VRTAEVTIETEERFVLHRKSNRPASLQWCPTCGNQVEMAAPELAAQLAGVSPRAIYAGVESGKVHFSEMPEGLLLICLGSLANLRASLDR
jgi:hypothetical protein